MTVLSIEQLRTKIARSEMLSSLLTLLDTVGFVATSWHEGDVGETLAQIGAEIGAKFSEYVAFMVDMGFNDTAEGSALTALSKSHYDNTRESSVATQQRYVLTCSAAAGPHTITLGGLVVQDDDGHIFRNVAGLGVVYPATLSSGGTLVVLVEAERGGSAYNVAESTITTLVTTFAGVTGSNEGDVGADNAIIRLGTNEESDPELRIRNSSKWGTLSEAETIADAVENIALNAAAGVKKVGIDDQNPNGAGTFDVYVAGEFATAGGGDVSAVLTALAARFFGSGRVRTFAAPERPLDLTGTVYYDASFASAAVEDAVERGESDTLTDGSLLAFIKTIPLGGFDLSPLGDHLIPKNDIENAIKETTINGAKCVKTVVITSPLTDIALSTFDIVTPGNYSGLSYIAVTG